mmetsp:Transcript_14121/g.30410  ORF Transcript_14121/g.30410 Transcript_14121/m.30410 type:complete len:443 (+) Transcript_14121:157-1485(+)
MGTTKAKNSPRVEDDEKQQRHTRKNKHMHPNFRGGDDGDSESNEEGDHSETRLMNTELDDLESGTPSKQEERRVKRARLKKLRWLALMCVLATLLWLVARFGFVVMKNQAAERAKRDAEVMRGRSMRERRLEIEEVSGADGGAFIGERPVSVEKMLESKSVDIERKAKTEKLMLEIEKDEFHAEQVKLKMQQEMLEKRILEQAEARKKAREEEEKEQERKRRRLEDGGDESIENEDDDGDEEQDGKFRGVRVGAENGANVKRVSYMLYRFVMSHGVRNVGVMPCSSVASWIPTLFARMDFDFPDMTFHCLHESAEQKDAMMGAFGDTSVSHWVSAEEWDAGLNEIDLCITWNWAQKHAPERVWEFFTRLASANVTYLAVNNNRNVKFRRRDTRGAGTINLRAPPFGMTEPLKIYNDVSSEPLEDNSLQLLIFRTDLLRPAVE